jgi:ABC-2 type transport system ATP-binding protein
MIKLENVTKRLGGSEILSDISFQVEPGEVVGFLGPNGAGKTTTLRLLCGFFPPTSGKVLVNGLDVTQYPLAVKRMVGYLPENVPFYGELPVKGYLRFVGEAKGLRGRDKKKQVNEVISLFKLESRSNQLLKTLSKGLRKRVCLAQSLLNNPKVLFLDEPTNSLDPEQIVEIRDYVKQLAGEKTILLSSHILSEVKAVCKKVIIIKKGRILSVENIDRINDLESRYMAITQERVEPCGLS